MNMQKLITRLEETRHNFRHIEDRPTQGALENLADVLESTLKELDELKIDIRSAANTASCLANGIIPD